MAETGRGHHRRLPAMGASDRVCCNHSGVGEKVAQVIIAETVATWRGSRPPPHRAPGGFGAGDERVRGKQSPAGKRHGNKWLNAMLVEAARSMGRIARQELPGRPARPVTETARGDGACPRVRVPVAHSMWCRPTGCEKRRSPTTTWAPTGTEPDAKPMKAHPDGSVAQLDRPGAHRDPLTSRLKHRSLISVESAPDAARPAPVVGYSRVCVRLQASRVGGGTSDGNAAV
jgi:hypothetical protein